MAQRVLVFGCELHVALLYERMFERRSTPVRSFPEDGDIGLALTGFDPTPIIAGTEQAFQIASDLVAKRGSGAKVGRHHRP